MKILSLTLILSILIIGCQSQSGIAAQITNTLIGLHIWSDGQTSKFHGTSMFRFRLKEEFIN